MSGKWLLGLRSRGDQVIFKPVFRSFRLFLAVTLGSFLFRWAPSLWVNIVYFEEEDVSTKVLTVDAFGKCFESGETHEGMTAFLEKREAKFTGK